MYSSEMAVVNERPTIAECDPELGAVMALERARQQRHIELIASENYASPCVLKAQSSTFTNQYAKGYPRKGYEHVLARVRGEVAALCVRFPVCPRGGL